MALVDVDIGCDVEDVDLAVGAGVDVELLGVQGVGFLDFKLGGEVDEAIVVEVHVLLIPVWFLGRRGLGLGLWLLNGVVLR